MAWVPYALGALSLASTAMGESDNNEQMAQTARQFGIKRAGVAAFKDNQLRTYTKRVQAQNEAKILADQEIELSQDKAEAQARVNAAAAGVAGTSVEQTVSETQINEQRALTTVARKSKQQKEQSKTDLVDSLVNAEAGLGTLDTTKRGGNTILKYGLSFASGYLSGL